MIFAIYFGSLILIHMGLTGKNFSEFRCELNVSLSLRFYTICSCFRLWLVNGPAKSGSHEQLTRKIKMLTELYLCHAFTQHNSFNHVYTTH